MSLKYEPPRSPSAKPPALTTHVPGIAPFRRSRPQNRARSCTRYFKLAPFRGHDTLNSQRSMGGVREQVTLTHPYSLSLSPSLTFTLTLSHTHSYSHSLSLTLVHSLSLSLTPTHQALEHVAPHLPNLLGLRVFEQPFQIASSNQRIFSLKRD